MYLGDVAVSFATAFAQYLFTKHRRTGANNSFLPARIPRAAALVDGVSSDTSMTVDIVFYGKFFERSSWNVFFADVGGHAAGNEAKPRCPSRSEAGPTCCSSMGCAENEVSFPHVTFLIPS